MKKIAISAVLAFLLVAYFAGSFDRLLVGVGLNTKECATSGLGVTYCGKALQDYKTNVVVPAKRARDQLKRAADEIAADDDGAMATDHIDSLDGIYGNCMSQGGDQASC